MAKISFSFSIVIISALLLLTQSGPNFAERLDIVEKDELESGSVLMQLLIEAETKALGLAKDVMELQTEVANSEDQLKCIPCGSACISSRNCCQNCYCIIKWEVVIPRCVRRKPSRQLTDYSVRRASFANEKVHKTTEDGKGSLLKELLKAEAVLADDIREEAMELQAQDNTSPAKLKCIHCGGECSSWNECCGTCLCISNRCLFLPNMNIMLNAQ